jgi:hypothetical protein
MENDRITRLSLKIMSEAAGPKRIIFNESRVLRAFSHLQSTGMHNLTSKVHQQNIHAKIISRALIVQIHHFKCK